MKNLFYFSCIFILFSGCKKEDTATGKTINLTGKAINFETNIPIYDVDAEIQIAIGFEGGGISKMAKTDKNGEFMLEFTEQNPAFSILRVSKKNHICFIENTKSFSFSYAKNINNVDSITQKKVVATDFTIKMMPSGFVSFNLTALDLSKEYEIEAVYTINNKIYKQNIITGVIYIDSIKFLSADLLADKPGIIRWKVIQDTLWHEVPYFVKAGEAVDVVLK